MPPILFLNVSNFHGPISSFGRAGVLSTTSVALMPRLSAVNINISTIPLRGEPGSTSANHGS